MHRRITAMIATATLISAGAAYSEPPQEDFELEVEMVEQAEAEAEAPAKAGQMQVQVLLPRQATEDIAEPETKLVLRYQGEGDNLYEGEIEFTLRKGILSVRHFNLNPFGFQGAADPRPLAPIEVPLAFVIDNQAVLLPRFLIGIDQTEFRLPEPKEAVEISVAVSDMPDDIRFEKFSGHLKDSKPPIRLNAAAGCAKSFSAKS